MLYLYIAPIVVILYILSKFNKEREYYDSIDVRLSDYISDNLSNPTCHHAYEILGVIRFLKLTDKYYFNTKKFKIELCPVRKVEEALRLLFG